MRGVRFVPFFAPFFAIVLMASTAIAQPNRPAAIAPGPWFGLAIPKGPDSVPAVKVGPRAPRPAVDARSSLNPRPTLDAPDPPATPEFAGDNGLRLLHISETTTTY